MKEFPSFITTEPSSARLSDRPAPPSDPAWQKILGGVLLLLFLFWVPGCLLIGTGIQMASDRMNGPLVLESHVRLESPDHRMRFEADTDGAIRLMDIHSTRTLHGQHISVQDYRRIYASWWDDHTVLLRCNLRYPAMALGKTYAWDCRSGVLKESDPSQTR